jgi:uncharacterized DUF497 family protein
VFDIFNEPVEFEWDDGNRDKNWIKHKVSCREAEDVFVNKPLLLGDNPKSGLDEKRYQAMGITDKGRLLFIIFTVRKGRVRIISARDMDRKEEKIYEEAKKTASL